YNYIDAYNRFDIDSMVQYFSENIVFENIQDGVFTIELKGLQAFMNQAMTAKSYFTERKQTIVAMNHFEDTTVINIEYFGILAVDFPNGLKRSDHIKLTGKSIFKFKDRLVIKLTDIS
nr:nuclear transport factor 2 family protein [Saprospiraceae bacterium]